MFSHVGVFAWYLQHSLVGLFLLSINRIQHEAFSFGSPQNCPWFGSISLKEFKKRLYQPYYENDGIYVCVCAHKI